MTLTERFINFYGDYYSDEIAELAQSFPRDQESLFIEAADLYQFDPDMLDDWRRGPGQMVDYAEEALAQYDLPADVDLSGATVRLTDTGTTIPPQRVTDIHPDDVGTYVAVEGQLSRITAKKPRIEVAAYSCSHCPKTVYIPQGRTNISEPHDCPNCERQPAWTIDQGESDWINQRKIKLEESIEERSQARGHSIPVYVEGDLCDAGPGDTGLPDHAGEKATILGTVQVDESQLSGRNADPETEYWLDAHAIVFDADTESDIDIEEHRDTFEALAARDDAVDLVAESLAPSLHAVEGDDLYQVRRACAAWLFNAYRVDPDGAGSKRGDLHMCLIGDPGVGKSTLMSYLHDVLPKSEFRTGTGLTEVGLTAAAVQEEFAGKSEWTLQPGILPRADGGHCLIDEIDGVVDENTKAIHDALEGEQMVKTDKAGIQADLPTRCALLAGGNPKQTRFDPVQAVTDQIDLDPALFDRMDLVFALEDEIDEAGDREKAGHILDAWDELTTAEIDGLDTDAATTSGPVPKDVLRAWVAHARQQVFPTLTEPAKSKLQEFYVEVRDLNDGHSGEADTAVPATPRTLEAGIRIAIAFARLRLSETVDEADAERAINLTKHVVGLRFDPESGEFDVQRVGKGAPKSQQERRDSLFDLIADLEPDDSTDGVKIETVKDKAVAQLDADRGAIQNDIKQLSKSGDLYKPNHGEVRTT